MITVGLWYIVAYMVLDFVLTLLFIDKPVKFTRRTAVAALVTHTLIIITALAALGALRA